MNVLIVDDQTTVIKGILNGVRFNQIGIKEYFSANSSKEAKDIISKTQIHIILCDIEMPGENGLELNKWIVDNYPEIIRILLTSHTNFQYAQESIKLGCFDYIVQPAPYDEIENSLKRAILKIHSDQQKEQIYSYGKLYKSFEPEMIDRAIMNLYSEYSENVSQSISLLNKFGYPIQKDSYIQVIIIDILPYCDRAKSVLSDNYIRNEILSTLRISKINEPVYALITLNKFKQYVILLFSNDDLPFRNITSQYTTFYYQLIDNLCSDIACYVGEFTRFNSLRTEIGKIHSFINNNVSKKPGFYQLNADSFPQDILDITEKTNRWERLLSNDQYNMLYSDIMSYIDFIVSMDKVNFRSLCDLHQQLTHIFFDYCYKNNIEIIDLFTDDYQYNDYMDGFKDIDSLRKSIEFIIKAIESSKDNNNEKCDIKKAKAYILENISYNLSVKDVADYVHLSPEYFTRLFKKETGQSIKSYIIQQKITVAKDLLGNQNIPVSLVALELGYNNFSHFTQMFKKHENMTPSEFRKKILQQDE